VTHYSETVGHLEIAVVEKGDETRLTFRTSWGTGLTIPTDRISEIIHALKGAGAGDEAGGCAQCARRGGVTVQARSG
jgi:hypothetical protein